MSGVAIERTYKLTRLGKGDYLLPSNDAQTLWRIASYEEDGSATYQKEFTPGKGPSGREYVLRGTFWNLYRWDGGFPTPEQLAAAFEDSEWTRWDFWSGPHATRADAVKAALEVTS